MVNIQRLEIFKSYIWNTKRLDCIFYLVLFSILRSNKNYCDRNGGKSSLSLEEESQDSLGVLSSPSSNYYVQAFLGEGCFGQVVKCLKVSTGEVVAVKMIKESSMTPEARNEVIFLRESSVPFPKIPMTSFFVTPRWPCWST